MNHDDPHIALRSSLSRLMTVGTVIAGVVLASGLVMMLVRPGAAIDLKHFAARERTNDSVARILTDAANFEPAAVVLLGVLILLLIPAARTLAACVIFAKERDKLFVTLALLVAGALAIGILY